MLGGIAAQPEKASVRAGNSTARRLRIGASSRNLVPRRRVVAKSLFTHEIRHSVCRRTVTLSSRGERMRADGLLERDVRRPIRVAADDLLTADTAHPNGAHQGVAHPEIVDT